MATLTSPTLSRLIKEVRIFLNQQTATNSFWSDEELSLYLNDAVRTYFLEVSERAEGQFDTIANLNLVSGVETVALPTDCFEVKVLYKNQDGYYRALVYKSDITEDYSTNNTSGSSTYQPYYYFRANNIVLRPQPDFSETSGLKLEYTAFPETLIWGGDTMSAAVSPVFKELIVAYAVYKAKLKESSVQGTVTYGPIQQHLSDLYKNFKDSVGQRSKYPQKIKPFNP